MKQSKAVKEIGPFHVTSHSQGGGVVSLAVYPAFPKYDSPDFLWAESRYNQNGGGPGIFTAIGTAAELAEFLNSVYPVEQVENWHKRIKAILDDKQKAWEFAQCETCGTVSSVTKEWKYCPICGNTYKKEQSQ